MLQKYEITTPRRKAHFLAQIAAESALKTGKSEGYKYYKGNPYLIKLIPYSKEKEKENEKLREKYTFYKEKYDTPAKKKEFEKNFFNFVYGPNSTQGKKEPF